LIHNRNKPLTSLCVTCLTSMVPKEG